MGWVGACGGVLVGAAFVTTTTRKRADNNQRDKSLKSDASITGGTGKHTGTAKSVWMCDRMASDQSNRQLATQKPQ